MNFPKDSRISVANKLQSTLVQPLKFLTQHFCLGEFDHVALIEKTAQGFLLSIIQQGGVLKFGEEFLGRTLGGPEVELLLEILTNGIGYERAEKLGVMKMFQGLSLIHI